MPTNRNKRTRKFRSTTISDAMLHFLQTGNYCVKKKFPDILPHDHFHIFQLGNPSPGYREKLRKIWMQHKAEIMQDWKAAKKKGQPWAAKEFDIK